LVCDLVRQGLLSAEEAATHPQRSVITQSLGSHKDIIPHVTRYSIEPGDRFLLCTDGLTSMAAEATIESVLAFQSAAKACEALIRTANDAGGMDNIAVVVMAFV
jgi:protein phosphatase